MSLVLRSLTGAYRIPVIDIFNYYIENSFAAYPDRKVPYAFFDILLKAAEEYPALVAEDEQDQVVGFGMLRAYHPFPVFSKTAEISYFIKPEWTGKGLGDLLLTSLIQKAKRKGIHSLLASVASLNEPSLKFHKKHGFIECGRFRKIGEKKGQAFDVVYMQKML
ncbi:MAG: N-acetyltransferase [Deltaproteobacteria bacterium]|nr:N-acetyltransferase [Deltaproteobacteria bacterium]